RTVTGYTITLLYVVAPLQILMNIVPHFGRAGVALSKVEELGVELAPWTNATELGVARPSPAWRRVELHAVTHTYRRESEDGAFRLGPIDLLLEPGELVFVVGGNGSGKTTLAKLLTGLYLPDS